MRAFFRSYVWFAFLPPLAIYFASLPPGVQLWDTAEMQLVPWIFGIAHPTGFPAFVILGFLFAHLEPFGNPAWRVSLFSAFAMAGSAAVLALFLRECAMPRWVAVLGAWVYAVGDTTWSRGSRTEVQALAVLFTGLTLLFAVRWRRTKEPRDAVIAAAAWGFGLATHPVTIFLAPGLAAIALLGWRELSPRRILAIALAVVVPLLEYAYIPLRSAYLYGIRRDPTLALGLDPGRPFWDTNHAASGLAAYLDAAPGQIGGGVAGVLAFSRWGPVAQSYGTSLLHEYGWAGVALGAIGLLLALRDRPLLWAGLIVSVGLPIPFILNYPEADTDRYFLGSYWIFAAAIAIGTYRASRAYARHGRLSGALAGVVLATLVGSLALANANEFNSRDDTSGPEFIDRVRAETPPNAIIVSEWTYVTALAYEAYATPDFGDRIPVSAWPTDYASFYPRWLKTRPLFVHVLQPPLVLPPGLGLIVTPLDAHGDIYRVTQGKAALRGFGTPHG